MDANRRLVLKGMALGSVASLAMGRSTRVLADAAALAADINVRPLLALVNGDAAGSVFLRGAIAAGGSRLRSQIMSSDLQVMLDLERELRRSDAMRIIGLLDDASGTLVVDLARSAGARVRWLGEHAAYAGDTRHHLLNADIAEDCAQRLGRQLHARGAGFEIAAQRLGEAVSQRELSARPRTGEQLAEWASAIGYQLASLDTPPMAEAPMPSGHFVADGHFVSFSIER